MLFRRKSSQSIDLSPSYRVSLLEGYATSTMAFHGMQSSWPRYTSEGFKKTRVPKKLYGDIQDFYQMATKYNRFKRGSKQWTARKVKT